MNELHSRLQSGLPRGVALILCAVLAVPSARLVAASLNPTALNIRITEGDSASYLIGSRATRGISVVILDENGAPVDGAIVSFSLPPDGPSGIFASGGRTEIVTTRPDGRASAWGMRWNRTPGPLEIRVTAVKGQVRAGVAATLFLVSSPQSTSSSSAVVLPPALPSPQSPDAQPGGQSEHANASAVAKTEHILGATSKKVTGHKWVWISLAIAGATIAGVGIAGHSGSSSIASATTTPTVSIGTPTITLGRP